MGKGRYKIFFVIFAVSVVYFGLNKPNDTHDYSQVETIDESSESHKLEQEVTQVIPESTKKIKVNNTPKEKANIVKQAVEVRVSNTNTAEILQPEVEELNVSNDFADHLLSLSQSSNLSDRQFDDLLELRNDAITELVIAKVKAQGSDDENSFLEGSANHTDLLLSIENEATTLISGQDLDQFMTNLNSELQNAIKED